MSSNDGKVGRKKGVKNRLENSSFFQKPNKISSFLNRVPNEKKEKLKNDMADPSLQWK